MKRNLDHGNYRGFREKRLQTDKFSEHSRNLRKTRRKSYFLEFKIEGDVQNSEN